MKLQEKRAVGGPMTIRQGVNQVRAVGERISRRGRGSGGDEAALQESRLVLVEWKGNDPSRYRPGFPGAFLGLVSLLRLPGDEGDRIQARIGWIRDKDSIK